MAFFFPIHRYRISNDPLERLFGSQLDFFDPWRDFQATETIRPDVFRWVNEPLCLARKRLQPRLTEKFRVQLNVNGFNPETIKTQVDGKKLIVQARYDDRQDNGDFSYREIRKSYDLPEHADVANMASFITPEQTLVIEVPVRHPEIERRLDEAQAEASKELVQFGQYRDPIFDFLGFLGDGDVHRRIVDAGNNGEKKLQITLPLKPFKPEVVKVSIKDHELTVQAEYNFKDKNRSERSFFRKSIILPPGTKVDELQSQMTDDGELCIEAPYVEQKEPPKTVEEKPKQ